METNVVEYKSLDIAVGKKADARSLAETCVCLANAQGAYVVIGIEDKDKTPPTGQKISWKIVNDLISRLRSLTDSVAITNPEIITHENESEYFRFRVLPTTRTIATTSTGKVFIRITDKCFPVSGEELTNLAAEKNAFQWELVTPFKVEISDADKQQISNFVQDIKNSPKVSDFIKNKEDKEILEHYQLTDGKHLTNLGLLWIGIPAQRARISYPITVQYIVYNEKEEKIRKETWHFHHLNPKELLLDIEQKAVELNYSTEIPDGLFRKQIRHYPKEVVRELLINAFAHKRFTTSGDIFIEVYPNRFEISNPGGLPLGITKDNILHERQRRNPHLIAVFQGMGLMEGEGSGYDLIYEKLSRDGKPFPEIESNFNNVKVTIYSNVIHYDILMILDYIDKNFDLSQKEFITLGVIAREKKILGTQLSEQLQLKHEDRLRNWIGSLTEKGIVVTRGIKKGTEYLLNPKLFSAAKLDIKPSLKTIEPHRLEALIEEDLKYNPESTAREIHKRIGDIEFKDIQKAIQKLVSKGVIEHIGGKTYRKYFLTQLFGKKI